MLTKTKNIHSLSVAPVRIIIFLLIFFLLFVLSVRSQNADKKNLPAWQSYKGVSIGMSAAQVREKLGAAKSEDADGFFYVFSETENAQILLDAGKTVRTISVVFAAEHPGAPAFADVFGKTAVAEPKPDGSIFKMMRYEDAGYWVSYNRQAGEKAMIIVMIQKF